MKDSTDSAPPLAATPAPRLRRSGGVALALCLVGVSAIGGAVGRAEAAVPAADDADRVAVASSAGSPRGEQEERWSWPVPPPREVARGFEAPVAQWSPGHRGVDLLAVPGTVVVAPETGVVHFAGVVVDRPVLSLEHAGGVLSSFEPVEATVSRGDRVQRGEPIGVLVDGHGDGPSSLHLGARVDGVYVSPLLFLGGVTPAVLLPTRR